MTERFSDLYTRFREELGTTFPELKPQLDCTATLSVSDALDQVYAALHPHHAAISARDNAWMSLPTTFIVPGVSLAPVWSAPDVTDSIRDTIWQYVGTLYCLAAELKQETPDMDFVQFIKKCMTEDSGSGPDSVWRDHVARFEQMLKKLEVELPQDEASNVEMNAAFRVLWEKVMATQFGTLITRLMREFTPRHLGLDSDSWETIMETHMTVEEMFEKVKRAYTTDGAAMEARLARIKDMLVVMVRNRELQPDRMLDDLKMLIKEVQSLPYVEKLLDEYGDTVEQFTEMIDNLKTMGVGRGAGDTGDPATRSARQRERLRAKLAQRRAERMGTGK
jgi:hypothetical protein